MITEDTWQSVQKAIITLEEIWGEFLAAAGTSV